MEFMSTNKVSITKLSPSNMSIIKTQSTHIEAKIKTASNEDTWTIQVTGCTPTKKC